MRVQISPSAPKERNKNISIFVPILTLTKTKGVFPNDNSLLKLLFAGIQNAKKKWTMPIKNWSLTISQLNIHFKERLKNALNLV